MIGDVIGALGLLFLIFTALGSIRAYVHRVPPAHGNARLAEELERVAGRRTRKLAVAVVDVDGGTQTAFIGSDEQTQFEIGSITKAFTGMLLAEAVRRGEVTLDSTLGALLPTTSESPIRSVTLRELCTHTSGLPRLPRTPGVMVRAVCSSWFGTNPYRGLSSDSVLRVAQRQRLEHRGQYRYSNLGTSVLGHALAAAAGHDFPTLLSERICAPIGMGATGIVTSADALPRGWTSAGRSSQPWLLSGYGPAGGAVSTITDMTRLMNALIDGTAPGLASLDSLGSFLPKQPARASGMFWVIDTIPDTDHVMVWHNGQTGGYSAHLVLYPQTRRAIVVVANIARATELQRIAQALWRWLELTSQAEQLNESP